MIEKVEKYCTALLSKKHFNQLPFHDLIHTTEVVANIYFIASEMNVTNDKLEPLVIAGWFHDTGHSVCYNGHEAESIKIAQDFLLNEQYSPEKIEIVLSCIRSTKLPQSPQNELDKIICDADIMHISSPHFFYRKLLLRREWELILGNTFTDKEWHELSLTFLDRHKFHTEYGRNVLIEGVKDNKAKVLNLLRTY